jgi:energy-coupling factor transporter ATP-binding protein EcfA2
MIDFIKTLMLSADKSDYPKSLSQMPAEWTKVAKDINSLCLFKGELIFVIGAWGSGKSTFLSTLIKDSSSHKKIKNSQRISLSSATNLNEVFTHFIPLWVKVVYLLIALMVSVISIRYWTWPELAELFLKEYRTPAFFVTIFLMLFVTNKFRIFYLVSSLVERLTGNKVKIIEDFDRGGLKTHDIYNSLFFRAKKNNSYIVALGYSSQVEKTEYVELAAKLEARIFLFNLSMDSLYSVLCDLYPNPPVQKGSWIKVFSARKLISIISKIQNNSESLSDEQKYFRFIGTFFNEIVQELSISDLSKFDFNSNGRSIVNSRLSLQETEIIDSYLQSIEDSRFRLYTKNRQGSSNWQEVVVRELFLKKNYPVAHIETF